MTDAVIVSAARSPIGRAHKGRLATVRADDLATTVAQASLSKVPDLDPLLVEDLYLGTWNHTGEQSQGLGRRVAVRLGRDDLPAATVNRACASSVQTTRMAFHAIRSGEGEAFLSVGVESVSRYPSPTPDTDNVAFTSAQERTERRSRGGHPPWVDPRESGDLPDFYIAMGQTAENVADLHQVSRQDQDAWAFRSQQRAACAEAQGFFDRQIVPIPLPDGSLFAKDESPRPQSTPQGLAELQPVFRPDGSVTAGNSCPLNDGAAALVVTSDRVAATLDVPGKVRILATAASALSPELMGLGPVESTRRALDRARLTIDDIDIIELNEAFASQVLASVRELGADESKVNVNGGAIALGHPFGMTGARLIGTAAQALAERDQQLALVTLCVGMGQGMAVILERIS